MLQSILMRSDYQKRLQHLDAVIVEIFLVFGVDSAFENFVDERRISLLEILETTCNQFTFGISTVSPAFSLYLSKPA